MLQDKLRGRKTVVLHVSAATQVMHIEPVLVELASRASSQTLSFYVLTNPVEVPAVRTWVTGLLPGVTVSPDLASRFLLFCDFMLSVDQGMIYPHLGCRVRACCFHGQPSKGNVYQRFNHRQINTLFLYGPLMRDAYLQEKESNPHWAKIDLHEVGQPLSDGLLNHLHDSPLFTLRHSSIAPRSQLTVPR
jgi:hypothetical protein